MGESKPARVSVVVVDDEPQMLRAWKHLLGLEFEVALFPGPYEAIAHLEQASADIVVSDIIMPKMNGMEFLAVIKQRWPDIEVVMTTGQSGVDLVVEAIKRGAYDFLTKPYDNPEAILEALNKAAHARALRIAAREASREKYPEIVGRSPEMCRVIDLVTRAAESGVPVLISGESGTGKELVAQALHRASPRRLRPFSAVNCSALTESLLEEELFGHVRGAFTGALADRRGIFEAADGGVVLLDEISDMSPRCQGMLLRTLQEGEVRPVGATAVRKVDVQVIAASNVDLEQRCREHAFRWDLYHRLNVLRIDLPPLRERLADLPLLVQFFLRKHSPSGREPLRVEAAALVRLARHDWPGNVRELENTIRRAIALADATQPGLTAADLAPIVSSAGLPAALVPAPEPEDPAADRPLVEVRADLEQRVERAYLAALLERHGSLSAAARTAGVDRSNFKRLLRRHKLIPS